MKGVKSGAIIFCFLLGFVGQVWAWEGTVTKVLDGDSLLVRRQGRTVEVRLYGIDTPEYRQAYGGKARQFSRELLERQTVTVAAMDTDRYGRTVALVTCQGRLVNRELVKAGLAWHYPRYCRSQPLCDELAVLEQEARGARRGLWSDPRPEAPWEWKQRQRSGSAAGSNGYRSFRKRW